MLVLAGANLVFCASILFKTIAALLVPLRHRRLTNARYAEMRERVRRGLPPVWRQRRDDADLPVYTILVPVYREANVVAKVIDNIGSLDYPKSKLDVMLLLEADDEETIAVARGDAAPGVRPARRRAARHAADQAARLQLRPALARGEFVVIYDAEDRPDPDQLREAVAAFDRDDFERERRALRRRPARRRAGLALLLQRRLQRADPDVRDRVRPLVRGDAARAWTRPACRCRSAARPTTSAPRRCARWAAGTPTTSPRTPTPGCAPPSHGYRVAVIDSSTGEEACSQTGAWIKQRTRWIKGYMVTAAVNTRHPVALRPPGRRPRRDRACSA